MNEQDMLYLPTSAMSSSRKREALSWVERTILGGGQDSRASRPFGRPQKIIPSENQEDPRRTTNPARISNWREPISDDLKYDLALIVALGLLLWVVLEALRLPW
jgi:hypothetical protein